LEIEIIFKMSINSTISIALASYNGEFYIKDQIISLLHQTIVPNEIIIVDDSSFDGTEGIVIALKKDYPIIKYYKNPVNLGVSESFKLAISKCNCNYIALSDQDDIWELDKLEKSLKRLCDIQKLNRPAIVFSDLKVIDSNNSILSDSFWKLQNFKTSHRNFKDILIGNIVTGCTIVMNNAMKIEVRKMPHNVIMHDHWIALVAYGVGDYGIIDETLVRYRSHGNSVTLKTKGTCITRLKFVINVIMEPSGNYLKSNIEQARLFLDSYRDLLSHEKLNDIKFIISLSNISQFIRMIKIAIYKYFFRKIRINFRLN
jgi:glycosyltransferase involved in cell wall biosynthesis